MPDSPDSFECRPAPPELQAAALSLLISQEPPDEKKEKLQAIIASTRNQPHSFDKLLVATQGSNVLGAVWGQLLAGRTALIWPPRLLDGQREELAERLLQALDASLVAAGVSVAQVLLPSADHEDARRLLRCGYQHGADLLYLVSFLQREPLAKPSHELEFEPYREDQRARLAALIERTYADTRDIPALDGQRDMEDVLEGYRQTGEFDADRWRFVRASGEDVGCLLLADHPQLQHWELVYMGIVPKARGKGWGAEVTAQAQRLARQAGRERLVLAVDAANDPAISAYSRAGFVEWLRRAVLLKCLSASQKHVKT